MEHRWKSTRATAEVIYSLAYYLKKTGQLGLAQEATVMLGDARRALLFNPDEYTGRKNQIVIASSDVDPRAHSTIGVEQTSKGHLFASATWHFSTERLQEDARSDYLAVTRTFFRRDTGGARRCCGRCATERSSCPAMRSKCS